MGETNHVRPPGLVGVAGKTRARMVRIILGELDQEWKTRGACKDHPRPDIWFPPPARSNAKIKRSLSERRRKIIIAEAKSICRRCPVRQACEDHADQLGDYNGIWGGKTPRERGRKRDET